MEDPGLVPVKAALPVPAPLRRYTQKYEAMRKKSKYAWPEYPDMLGWLQETALTFQDIGDKVGVSRECVRQVCDRYFDGVRRKEDRRAYGSRHPETVKNRRAHRQTELKQIAEKIARESSLFVLLEKHAANIGVTLGLIWDGDLPLRRSVQYDGRKHYVVFLRSVARLCGKGLYAHSISPMRTSVGDSEGILVVIEVEEPISVSKLYQISVSDFFRVSPSHILIRQNERYGRYPAPAIDWEHNHLVSKLE